MKVLQTKCLSRKRKRNAANVRKTVQGSKVRMSNTLSTVNALIDVEYRILSSQQQRIVNDILEAIHVFKDDVFLHGVDKNALLKSELNIVEQDAVNEIKAKLYFSSDSTISSEYVASSFVTALCAAPEQEIDDVWNTKTSIRNGIDVKPVCVLRFYRCAIQLVDARRRSGNTYDKQKDEQQHANNPPRAARTLHPAAATINEGCKRRVKNRTVSGPLPRVAANINEIKAYDRLQLVRLQLQEHNIHQLPNVIKHMEEDITKDLSPAYCNTLREEIQMRDFTKTNLQNQSQRNNKSRTGIVECTNAELTDMLLVFGHCQGNGRECVREYRQRFPTQTFAPEEILERVAEDRTLSTRRSGSPVEVSKNVVHTVIKEQKNCFIHIISKQCTIFYLLILVTGRKILLTDEACITKKGIANLHNEHVYAEENSDATRQDGTPPHFTLNFRNSLNRQYRDRWNGRGNYAPVNWLPRSPDMTPLDFFLWGALTAIVHFRPVDTEQEFFYAYQGSLDSLKQDLSRFWQIDNPLQIKPNLSFQEVACEHFAENTYRDASGRFVVSILFKSNPAQLGDSKTMPPPPRRSYSIERKLNENPSLKGEYTLFMREYESLHHITKIKISEVDNFQSFYLPHHPVVKYASLIRKVRVVFDASGKSDSNISLNELQLVGLTLQRGLFSILVNFRQYLIGLSADITKMYRQILTRLEGPRCYYYIIFYQRVDRPPTLHYVILDGVYNVAKTLRLILEGMKVFSFHPGSLHSSHVVLQSNAMKNHLSSTRSDYIAY
ncbi:hypothetical protein ILUMI_22395 [Ignelater luminosus]|uniref:DUF4817 domain-containing protein n=1 Tax=Ignelater luminosus TaxID=2038154 RepID=A0A8K0CAT2_IGNLU|nr:hypothetical protein ILUMI_22395 [Ignelater luminosus]